MNGNGKAGMDMKNLYIPNHTKWVNFYQNTYKRSVPHSASDVKNSLSSEDGRVLTLHKGSLIPIEQIELPNLKTEKTDIQLVSPSQQSVQQAISQLQVAEDKTIHRKVRKSKTIASKKADKRKKSSKRGTSKEKSNKRVRKNTENIFV